MGKIVIDFGNIIEEMIGLTVLSAIKNMPVQ